MQAMYNLGFLFFKLNMNQINQFGREKNMEKSSGFKRA
jgi:hypothetical protein